jgi:uncharacterized protein YjlB
MRCPLKRVAAVYCLLIFRCESLASNQHDFHSCETPDNYSMKKSSGAARRAWGEIENVQNHLAPFDIFRLYMDDDGTFPNNSRYPLLLYKAAFTGSEREASRAIVDGKKWTSPWAWGIYTFHHYHSTAWELLLCVQGRADVMLGGENGPTFTIEKGDLALVPPGFAHKQLDSRGDFTLLGSYPTSGWSESIDTLRGAPTEQQRRNIVESPFPPRDPIFGLELETLF